MTISTTGNTKVLGSKFLLTSSALALVVSANAHAQTITSAADGETINNPIGSVVIVAGAPAVDIENNDVTLNNDGTLTTTGVTQTVEVSDGTTGAVINNGVTGIITADSRGVQIDGDDATLNNEGSILGTGVQRNGTVYTNVTAYNFALNNDGIIDAVVGGAGFSAELAEEGTTINITNSGLIAGRGDAGAGAATAGDGIRFERTRNAGALDATTSGLLTGNITNSGTISSDGANGTVAGIRFVNGVSFAGTIDNLAGGTISGVQNGLYFGNATPAGGGDFTGAVVNNAGTISSGSRALNIDGTGLTINNLAGGQIIGTGNQRNGTVYADSTAQDFTLNNDGVIDAGAGNEGAGFSAELTAEGNDFTIVNSGTIQGRGNASAGAATAGDGLRFERTRAADGTLMSPSIGLFTGSVTNAEGGLIASEGANGTVAGVRFVNGVSFQGTFDNAGTITGVQNGVYFGNPTPAGGGDHIGGVFNNLATGVISSDSRAFNIDGTGLVINNAGTIIGTGDQRNGTVYADSTAQDFTLNNDGVIDAGEGNQGAGFSAELSEAGNNFDIVNTGTIQGRGTAGAGSPLAGDGIRFERERVNGLLDGTTSGLFTGTITNSGLIDSEGDSGTTAGIRFVNGVSFSGTLDNLAGGTISGVQNGLYFGNATPAGGGDFTGAVVNNAGTISSGSRALNIDGTGLTVNNLAGGQILGTGQQRNGTVYADATAQDFTLNNAGTIDAVFDGAAFSVELSEAGNNFDIINSGTIQGRGVQGAGSTAAGDGLRFERTRVGGVLEGSTTGLFTGTITNSGLIDSEADNGTTAGIRFVNGVSFSGTIDNLAGGTISGVNNGLYFGNATPAGGGIFTGAVVNNAGTISSGSRALNIDGTGLTVNNSGSILGTGAQRNGTVYADGTANNFTLNNTGTIDAVVQGSGVSVQVGTADGDVRSFTLVNDGTIAGRGEALASGASAGLRLFNGAGAGTTVTVTDDIINNGTISSETGAAVLIENVTFTGTFFNNGTLTGPSAVDASTALSALNFVQNGGALNGSFVGSAFDDTLTFADGTTEFGGDVLGNVAVTVAAPATLNVNGDRTIEGNLTVYGALNFDLSADTLLVDGDTVLNAGSVVNIATDSIGQGDIGASFTVLDETGAFTDNGVTVNLAENDFLIDYQVDIGSITVTTSANDLSAVSTDANVSGFGGGLNNAIAANQLPTDVFNALNDVTDAAGFETTALSLLPAINEGVTREIYETQNASDAFIADRLISEKTTGLWGQALVRTADRDAESTSVSGYNADAFGLSIGVDFAASDTVRVGLAYSYAEIDVDSDNGSGSQSDINSSQISAYLGYNSEKVFVNGLVGYSFSDADTTRTSAVGPVTGAFDLDGIRAQVNAGYELGSETLSVTPFVGFNYASLSSDSYTENGALNLNVDAGDVDFFEGRIGARLAAKGDNGFALRGNVAYAYDFVGDARTFDLAFAGSGTPFQVSTTDGAQSRFEFGTGVRFGNVDGLSVALDYQGELASSYSSHSGVLRLRYAF
ncbi:autotransporter domain-containing protein [Parasphingorhabdus sp. DH2-15]|uniref:autotransporter domain-containing protein n=1 Tax=Parasphingorhabdus sp. DH2-15 TaxID=3444112 RepID=UPI003F6894D6